jgi:hypothetical protein
MKRRPAIILALALFALPAFAAPDWWIALHGSYLTADELAQVQPIQQAVAPVVAAIAATSNITYLPKFYGSVGGGAVVPGSGKFAYEAIAAYIGMATYAMTVQEFTLSKGTVQSCTMAGVSKVMYQFGFVSLGITGLGGGCNSTSGSSGGAGAAQGFASFHLGKSGMSIVATADKTFTTDGRQGVKATFGVSYGK